MSTIEKRRLEKDDIEEFTNLRVEMLLSDETIEYDKDELIKQTKIYFEEHINKSLYIFGIFNDGKLVAISGMEILKRLPTPKIGDINSDICYICTVYTKPDYREKGYATSLLNEIIEYSKANGITRFKLSAHNPKAIRIYKKLGFKKAETMMQM